MAIHPPQPPGPPDPWRPTSQQRYFVILGDGSIKEFPWAGTPFDYRAWQFGNCFRTHQDATHAREGVKQVLQAFHIEHKR
jgi:hypothetical protein